jgi:HptB-dependent secretion and biofilm anti anti-sigma factor
MRFEFNNDDTTVSISGEFTFTDHVAFKAIASRLLERQGTPIIIDLAKLEFIDSAGLGMLLIVREEADKAHRSLVLRGPCGQVKRMFDVTKFDTLFTVEA